MSNGFDPSKMGRVGGSNNNQKKEWASRLFMDVKEYVKGEDGFSYAAGTLVGKPNEQVRVRLTTVSERAGDRPDQKEDFIRGQYSTNSLHRESLADKEKNGIRWLSFDEAHKTVVAADGVQQYRAHWPKTMDTTADAEVITGLMHIRLTDAVEATGNQARQKAKAYVEHLVGSAVATGDNIDDVLFKAVSITDNEGRATDPMAILRIKHEGKVVAAPRLYPSRYEDKVFDENEGADKTIYKKTTADVTMADLIIGKEGATANYTETMDVIRAVRAGLKGEDEPVIMSTDAAVRDNVLNYYHGVKEGALTVEVIAAQKLDFGRDSGVTYLKDRERSHLKAYVIEEPAGGDKVRRAAGYANTVLMVHRHPDGEPYVTFASPNAMFPKSFMTKLNDVKIDKLPTLGLEAEAGLEAPAPVEQEVGAPESEEGDRYEMADDGPM